MCIRDRASTCWVKVDTTGNARFASSSGALGNIARDADGTLKSNGVLCSGWVNLGGGVKTYADPISHKAMTSWIKDGTETYYINPSSGVVSTGWEQINGAWYLFNYSGKMLTNWQKVGGNWYYCLLYTSLYGQTSGCPTFRYVSRRSKS